jgi:hypothetical protein
MFGGDDQMLFVLFKHYFWPSSFTETKKNEQINGIIRYLSSRNPKNMVFLKNKFEFLPKNGFLLLKISIFFKKEVKIGCILFA